MARDRLSRITLIEGAVAGACRFRGLYVADTGTGGRIIGRETVRAIRDLLLLGVCEAVFVSFGTGLAVYISGLSE